MIPSERERDARRRCPGGERAVAGRLGQRNLAPFDHRHPLAMLHLELLRALPQAQENDEDPGKHAEHEDHREQALQSASWRSNSANWGD